MRRSGNFRGPFACALLGTLLAVLAAALITSHRSSERDSLDRTLATAAGEKATLVRTELERAQALALVTSRIPAFSELYAQPGSAAWRIARIADPHRGIEAALRYVWQLYPDRFPEAGYVDADGNENARIVRGAVTPAAALKRNVRAWPSFWQALTTPVNNAWITEPFVSPTAGVPVVAATSEVAAGGRVRAYVELELAVAAINRGLSSDVDLRKAGLAVVTTRGSVVTRVGRQFGRERSAPHPGFSTIAGWRLSVREIASDATPEQWFVVAGARAPSVLAAVGSTEVGTIALAVAMFLLATLGFIRTRAQGARVLLEEQQARAEAERRSRIDPLTGLFNRRHAIETLEQELARSGREGGAVGLLMFDVDRFKQVNDQHGHTGGDAVLNEVARRLRAGVRVYDTVARVGGEEFCVVAPSVSSEDELAELGDRLRHSIAERAMLAAPRVALPVTISVGAAVVHGVDGSAEHVFDCADRALYAAKRRGRNRLVRFSHLDREDVRAEQPECLRIAEALAVAQDVREEMPTRHNREVAELSAAVARRLGLPDHEILRVQLSGWLHDIGKVAIPDGILTKRGPLTEQEWESMRSHATVGEELISHLPELSLATKGVRHHHERWDGGGYPDRLAGPDIPVEARIVGAVDAWSAMTSERPWKSARGFDDSLVELRRCAGTQFDPEVVGALVEELRERSVPGRVAGGAPGGGVAGGAPAAGVAEPAVTSRD